MIIHDTNKALLTTNTTTTSAFRAARPRVTTPTTIPLHAPPASTLHHGLFAVDPPASTPLALSTHIKPLLAPALPPTPSTTSHLTAVSPAPSTAVEHRHVTFANPLTIDIDPLPADIDELQQDAGQPLSDAATPLATNNTEFMVPFSLSRSEMPATDEWPLADAALHADIPHTPSGTDTRTDAHDASTFVVPDSPVETFGSLGLPVGTTQERDTARLLLHPANLDLLSTITVSPDQHSPDTLQPSHRIAPLPSSADRYSSSLPSHLTMTVDELRASTGFLSFDTLDGIIKHPELYHANFTIAKHAPDPTLTLGSVASINKRPRNTAPIPRGSTFGDTVHCDIVFGPQVGHGGISHALLLVDRHSRCKFMFPLKNLTTDLRDQFSHFLAQVGTTTVRRILTDCDDKLLEGDTKLLLNQHGIFVGGAPSEHQNQNGLCERHWQTIQRMARAWLAHAQLPPSFWFWAVKRATEVLNYFPTDGPDGLSTPFQLAYDKQPDLRTLFPMFSVGYARKLRDGPTRRNKFTTHSVPVIVVGKSPTTDGYLCWCPSTGSTLTTVDLVFDPTIAAGPYFNYSYTPTIFRSKSRGHADPAPLYRPASTVYPTTMPPGTSATVIDIPSPTESNYAVALSDGTEVLLPADQLLPAPVSPPTMPTWFRHNAKTTLYLDSMLAPKQGTLCHHPDNDTWTFKPGKKADAIEIPLDLPAQLNMLLSTGQLFQGFVNFDTVHATKAVTARLAQYHSYYPTYTGIPIRNGIAYESNPLKYLHTTSVLPESTLTTEDPPLQLDHGPVARHVTAQSLHSLTPPSSLKQISKLSPTDQATWLGAYNEEYDGLIAAATYTVITIEEYYALCKTHNVGSIMPSMAIANIKTDADGRPLRAKYRIVARGDKDTHPWENKDIAAPVLASHEFRTLCALAVHHRRRLKQADAVQAFLQAHLPEHEYYVVRPPPNCPRSSPNTLWLLNKSLYGLRRAPKLWFETMRAALLSLGLTSTPESPCLFSGTIIPGSAPLHLGLYVDDMVYFSTDPTVERRFEDQLSSFFPVNFLGVASYFLGIHLHWTDEPDGHLSVHCSQSAYIDEVAEKHHLHQSNPVPTPYRSGSHVDTITGTTSDSITAEFICLVGSLGWLASNTRPDLSTIYSLLSQWSKKPNSGHIELARYALQYLVGTRTHGISFTSLPTHFSGTYNHYPITHADANWGPQDASQPNPKPNTPTPELPLFATRSISGFITFLAGGPIHWKSSRQPTTALSSTAAEIHATNAATKFLLGFSNSLQHLDHKDIFFPPGRPTTIHNDNRSCVDWYKGTTTKNTRHIQIWENHIRENIANDFLEVLHIPGSLNLADIFTKEMKDDHHFIAIRDILVTARPSAL